MVIAAPSSAPTGHKHELMLKALVLPACACLSARGLHRTYRLIRNQSFIVLFFHTTAFPFATPAKPGGMFTSLIHPLLCEK